MATDTGHRKNDAGALLHGFALSLAIHPDALLAAALVVVLILIGIVEVQLVDHTLWSFCFRHFA